MPTEPLKLHLGCGYTRLDGWTNCDLMPNPNVQVAFDVQKRWPFPDSSTGAIYASHLLEHLERPLVFFEEAWRVLKPNGTMQLRLPFGDHRAAWWDITHIRPWYAENFCMFQPDYGRITGNPQHQWHMPYGVEYVSLRVAGKFARPMRWKFLRRFLLKYGENIQNFVEEMWVSMYALKTKEDVQAYQLQHPIPNYVVSRYAMYRHQWELRHHLEEGETPELVTLADMMSITGWSRPGGH